MKNESNEVQRKIVKELYNKIESLIFFIYSEISFSFHTKLGEKSAGIA
jgi:hypothetical protein